MPYTTTTTTLQQQAYERFDFSAAADGASDEQHAWFIRNLQHIDDLEATRLAEEMRATHPESAWTWFAIAHEYREDLDHFDDNKLAAEKLASETDEALVIARAVALNSIAEHDAAMRLLDAVPPSARVWVAKGEMLQDEPAIAAYREALKIDPSNIAALNRLGSMLKQIRRRDEAKPLLESAAKLSRYVMALQLPNAAELEAWIRDSDGDPYVLSLAARGYQQLKMNDRMCEVQDRILREAPASAQALTVLMSRAKSNATWRDVLDYPYRRDPDAIATASSVLLRDEKDDARLVALVHNIPLTVNYVPQLSSAVQKLTDRKLDLVYADRVARRLIDLNERYLLGFQNDPPESRERMERYLRGMVHDTLGWVWLARGNTSAAQKEILAARELYPESAAIVYHLARTYEAEKQITEAEQLYREGLALQTNGVNPNRAALEALYRRKHKTLAGFDAYLVRVDSNGTAASKQRVLESRIAKPVRAPEFRLKTLDGRTLSLADLKGKVAVVNFWGVWCGWCVKEMPDIVKLAKRYADDDRVRIVTVDTDGDPSIVRQWMTDNHYDFTVLLDDGWAHRSGVLAYPTTWFLDPQGRIAFKKEGWTEKLVDQFSWRIDVLRK
ncbi:MAG TPA: redoxin domain-containing protein [Thermoanaerobaculia bacterium]|nr:redoxin domain-containing protein [Thermoanaerobaculia bacterium]